MSPAQYGADIKAYALNLLIVQIRSLRRVQQSLQTLLRRDPALRRGHHRRLLGSMACVAAHLLHELTRCGVMLGSISIYHWNLSEKRTDKLHFREIQRWRFGDRVSGGFAADRPCGIARRSPSASATVTEAIFLLLPSFVGALGDVLHLSATLTGLLASADLTGIALTTATAPVAEAHIVASDRTRLAPRVSC